MGYAFCIRLFYYLLELNLFNNLLFKKNTPLSPPTFFVITATKQTFLILASSSHLLPFTIQFDNKTEK